MEVFEFKSVSCLPLAPFVTPKVAFFVIEEAHQMFSGFYLVLLLISHIFIGVENIQNQMSRVWCFHVFPSFFPFMN